MGLRGTRGGRWSRRGSPLACRRGLQCPPERGPTRRSAPPATYKTVKATHKAVKVMFKPVKTTYKTVKTTCQTVKATYQTVKARI